MQKYGCLTCGSTSFHDASGTRIEAVPGPGVPVVSRVTLNALDSADAAFLDMLWMCQNGHQVQALGPLWAVLEIVSITPMGFEPVALPPNEQV
jgi:hypothetical protein